MHFHSLKTAAPGHRIALAGLAVLAALGGGAAHRMDAAGHHITGMTNQVVWGVPHVFALALILAASGALNAASMASVFRAPAYRPLARLSALSAAAFLIGGLLILLLDLGRPERLVIALTHYNFTSVFAWNLFLYAGFTALAAAYLHALFSPPQAQRRARITALLALLWRLILTTGSGAIFAVLVARPGYHAALLIPLFIAMALSLGGAAFCLVTSAVGRWHGNFDAAARAHQARLLAWFIAAQLVLTAALHGTNLLDTARAEFARFVLFEGGVYTALFWAQALIGGVLPLLLSARGRHLRAAAALVIAGGLAHLYVIIIGGQALPLPIFPGHSVAGALGEVAPYTPSLPEFLLGLGGAAAALLLLLGALRVLPLLPPPDAAGKAR